MDERDQAVPDERDGPCDEWVVVGTGVVMARLDWDIMMHRVQSTDDCGSPAIPCRDVSGADEMAPSASRDSGRERNLHDRTGGGG